VKALQEENHRLMNTMQLLARRLARFQAQQALVRDLYGRLKAMEFECELVPGRVVGTGSLPYGRTRMLNVGRAQGAETGTRVTSRRLLTDRSKALPVPPKLATLSQQVLVGWVSEAWAYGADLQLVTDAGFQINGYIRRDIRLKTPDGQPRQVKVIQRGDASEQPLTARNNKLVPVVAQGDGRDRLLVRDVKENDRILPGDMLVTRGDSYLLPEQVPIGKVEKIKPQPHQPGFVTLVVKPLADLSSLRNVLVIVPTQPPQEED
ncbi:MAG: rod shape-determining protein MreC, partial [Planctomycetota bacterium]